MLIINIYFFIVFIKFFLFFNLFRLDVLKKIKNQILYFFIYDLHLSVAIIVIRVVKYNLIFNALVLGLGPVSFLFQCYQLFNLVNLLVRKKHINDSFENSLLAFGAVVSFFRFLYTIHESMSPDMQVHIVDIFRDSKMLFFCVFFAFVIFQLYFVFPSMVRLFYFMYCYRVRKSFIQMSLLFLASVFLVKIGLDYFQSNILQFFKAVNADDNIADLIRIQSDRFLNIISLFSFLTYTAIFYFVNQAKKILFKDYAFLIDAAHQEMYLFINSQYPIQMSLEGKSFQDFIFAMALENIRRRFTLIGDEVTFVFFHERKDEHLFQFFNDHRSVIYQAIMKNHILSYDYYYDYLYLLSLDMDEKDPQYQMAKEVLRYLEKHENRIVIPFFFEKKIIGFLRISLATLNFKPLFLDQEVMYLYQVAQYVEKILDQVYKDPFYRRLQYQNKIVESNLEENNNLFKKFYAHLSVKISEISQVIVLEDRKENIILYGLKDEYRKNVRLSEFLKIVHKNIPPSDFQKFFAEAFIADVESEDFSVFSTGKIKLGKYQVSLHTFLPFIKKKNNFFTASVLNQKVDDLFPGYVNIFSSERGFFFEFDLNYTIKIVINSDHRYDSFFKIVDYISETPCIIISLKKFFADQKKVLDYFRHLLNSNKPYNIFFVDIEQNIYDLQYIILDIYSEYVVFIEKILVKLFFLVENEGCIKNIHYKIIQTSSSLRYQSSSLGNLTVQHVLDFLKNYTTIVIKKYYSEESISKFIQDHYFFLKEKHSLYYFLDSFEKMINAYKVQAITTTYSKEFYIKEGARLGKAAFKNGILMDELLRIYNSNFTNIAILLGVHKSSVSRFFKKRHLAGDDED